MTSGSAWSAARYLACWSVMRSARESNRAKRRHDIRFGIRLPVHGKCLAPAHRGVPYRAPAQLSPASHGSGVVYGYSSGVSSRTPRCRRSGTLRDRRSGTRFRGQCGPSRSSVVVLARPACTGWPPWRSPIAGPHSWGCGRARRRRGLTGTWASEASGRHGESIGSAGRLVSVPRRSPCVGAVCWRSCC